MKYFLIAFLSITIFFAAPPAFAQDASFIPSKDTEANAPTDCINLQKRMRTEENTGKWLAIKVKCGYMTLGDAMYYVRYMMGYIFNIIGTLGIIAVIRAGYKYIWDQKKEEGYKAIQGVVIGLVVAFGSFTIARIIFSFFQVF